MKEFVNAITDSLVSIGTNEHQPKNCFQLSTLHKLYYGRVTEAWSLH